MDSLRTPAERFGADLSRTVDRLRTLGLARLGASFAPEPTRSSAARGVAQVLADRAADLERRPRRALPTLADSAVGDQLAVCGHDLLDAVAGLGARVDVAEGVDPDAELVAAAELVLDLRRRL